MLIPVRLLKCNIIRFENYQTNSSERVQHHVIMKYDYADSFQCE